jgi:mitochondrial fission protein ELM1
MSQTRICWIVSDGRRGIENQALGLAEAVRRGLKTRGEDLQIERAIAAKDGFTALPDAGAPDLWIGCGRAAIPLARKHRDIFPKACFVYVQDPRAHYQDFDLIFAPDHDRPRRKNMAGMIGSPNRISPQQLEAGEAEFADRLAALPGPRAALLIGGPSKRFKLDESIADYLQRRISHLCEQGLSLMITASRRTPAGLTEKLAEMAKDDERIWMHSGDGPNPYFAFLSAADWVFVTEESTNMLVEAATAGKPLYALPMAGRPGKFARLHAGLEAYGALRPYLGRLESWTYPPLRETDRAAELLIARWLGAKTDSRLRA